MTFQSYALAAGLNNAAGLANIETAFPLYQGNPLIVQGRGRFIPGLLRVRADFQHYLTGITMFTWLIPVMGINQYLYLQSTYSTGGNSYSGKVTAKTRKVDDTYGNFSAIYRIPTPDLLERRQDAFLNVEIVFSVEAAL